MEGDLSVHVGTLYRGAEYPRFDYRSDVAELLAFYRARFVARGRELAELAAFAVHREPGYLIVEAPGGFGKSTLIAQLVGPVDRPRSSARASSVFFFVRAEGGRNTAVAFLQAVNSQLLALLDLPGGTPLELDALRAQFSELWAAAVGRASEEAPLLLVVDGLDESADDPVGIVDVLQPSLREFVHVIVSSRPTPALRERVSREHPLQRAAKLRLEGFDADTLRLLLIEFGVPAEEAERAAPRVLALTRGEPLFARFVCEQVAAKGLGELDRLERDPPADAEGYFRDELARVRQLGSLAWEVTGLLTAAREGLTAAELADVLTLPLQHVRRDGIAPLSRFLLPTERLEFFHRRLRDLVASEVTDASLTHHRAQLIAWCGRYKDRGWPAETPNYTLVNYAAHLQEVQDTAALIALPTHTWLRRHRASTRALAALVRDAEAALTAASTSAEVTADLLRICDVIASAHSVATNAPPAAVGVLAHTGAIKEALEYAELMLAPLRQVSALRRVALAHAAAGDDSAARRLLDRAVAVVEDYYGQYYVSGGLIVRPERLQEDERFALVDALARVRDPAGIERLYALQEKLTRVETKAAFAAHAISALAQCGGSERATQLLEDALREALAPTPAPYYARSDPGAGARLGWLAIAAEQVGARESVQRIIDAAEALTAARDRALAYAGLAASAAEAGDTQRSDEAAAEALRQLAEVVADERAAIAADAIHLMAHPALDPWARRLADEAMAASLSPQQSLDLRDAVEALALVRDAEGLKRIQDEHPQQPHDLQDAVEALALVRDAEGLKRMQAEHRRHLTSLSLVALAAGLARCGEPTEAEAAIEYLKQRPAVIAEYIDAAVELAVSALAALGLVVEAERIASAAETPSVRADATALLAEALLNLGRDEDAKTCAHRALEQSEHGVDAATAAAAFAALSLALSQVGDRCTARKAARSASNALENISRPLSELPAIQRAVTALLAVECVDEARTLIEPMLVEARSHMEPTLVESATSGGYAGGVSVVDEVARAYARAGRTAEARSLLDRVPAPAADRETGDERLERMLAEADLLRELGDEKEANARLATAVNEATDNRQSWYAPTVRSLAELVRALGRAGEHKKAARLARKCLRLAAGEYYNPHRTYADRLARALAEVGLTDEARELAQRALAEGAYYAPHLADRLSLVLPLLTEAEARVAVGKLETTIATDAQRGFETEPGTLASLAAAVANFDDEVARSWFRQALLTSRIGGRQSFLNTLANGALLLQNIGGHALVADAYAQIGTGLPNPRAH